MGDLININSLIHANKNVKFVRKNFNSNQIWNNGKCQCECKNFKKYYSCKKYSIWNPGICTCKNCKYLENVIDDSVVISDEILETIKINPIVINKKSTP